MNCYSSVMKTNRQTILASTIALLLAASLLSCDRTPAGRPVGRWQGLTMGTVWSLRLAPPLPRDRFQPLLADIEAILESVNAQMSVWREDSEISRFNRADAQVTVPISAAFAKTVEEALKISDRTGGAFDPTLQPLIDLWGFGPAGRDPSPPDETELSAALARTGFRKLQVLSGPALMKTAPGLQLDLGAIAKGYGVDAVADRLRQEKLTGFLIEIGGEIYAAGTRSDGRSWKIGVETPVPGSLDRTFCGTLALSNRAVATSGDYHNFRTDGKGGFFTHVLDPRTGRPVQNRAASVTVIADRCATADALATALFVAGPEKGLPLLETFPDAQALFILHKPDGTLEFVSSPDFIKTTSFEKVASQIR